MEKLFKDKENYYAGILILLEKKLAIKNNVLQVMESNYDIMTDVGELQLIDLKLEILELESEIKAKEQFVTEYKNKEHQYFTLIDKAFEEAEAKWFDLNVAARNIIQNEKLPKEVRQRILEMQTAFSSMPLGSRDKQKFVRVYQDLSMAIRNISTQTNG